MTQKDNSISRIFENFVFGPDLRKQNVQRLLQRSPALAQYAESLSLELGCLIQHDINILDSRDALISSGKHKGNTKELKNYKEMLPQQLSELQLQWGIGLVLSDATLQLNNNMKCCRLKMQQAEKNGALLFSTFFIFLPLVMSEITEPFKRNNSKRREIQTIQHTSMMIFVDLFQDSSVPLSKKCEKRNHARNH